MIRFLFVLLGISPSLLTRLDALFSAAPIVKTECGPVIGLDTSNQHGSLFQYLGIRYAAAPIGRLRWQMPIGIRSAGECFTGTYSATSYGPSCTQLNILPTGEEDCLFLNIFTPNITANLPVMFYIHGGGLMFGSGADSYSNPSLLSQQLNIVSVTINYRLNAFGFLALKELTEHSTTDSSGNYGFGDQLEALRWVRRNINKFGGDPSQITVAGHSSGGTSIIALLASPLIEVSDTSSSKIDRYDDGADDDKDAIQYEQSGSSTLFQRAWIMSGSPLYEKSLEEASADNRIFVEKSGCSSSADIYACLMQLSTGEILASIPYNVYPYWSGPMLADFPLKDLVAGGIAIVDGYVVRDKPLNVFKQRESSSLLGNISMVWGNMAQEIDIMPTMDLRHSSLADADALLSARIFNITADSRSSTQILHLYDAITQNMSPQQKYETLASDISVTCGTNDIAAALTSSSSSSSSSWSASKGEVYRYVVASVPSIPFTIIPFKWSAAYSFHLLDLLALFHTNLSVLLPHPYDTHFEQLSAQLQQHFDSFVHEGKIDEDEWKPFTETSQRVWVYSNEEKGHLQPNFRADQCEWWWNHSFHKYAWVN